MTHISIYPIKLVGKWDMGWALDRHVTRSTPKGENVYGHMEYDTTRSELGELVFQLKYRNNQDAVEGIIELISPFLDECEELNYVDIVLPAPPSNKNRSYQPAFLIAEAIADYLGKSYADYILVKTSDNQSKNLEDKRRLDGSVIATCKATKKHNILIVDDLFQSGATLNECVQALKDDFNLCKVYVLAMTKTKA